MDEGVIGHRGPHSRMSVLLHTFPVSVPPQDSKSMSTLNITNKLFTHLWSPFCGRGLKLHTFHA